jgi:hypothetical protein
MPVPCRGVLPEASAPPVAIRDRADLEKLLPNTGARQAALIPIAEGERSIGLLSVGRAEGAATADRLEQWAERAREIAACLRDLKTAKRDLQLDLISRLGRRDVWEMDLPDFFDLTVVSIRETLGYYNVSLFALEEGDRELVLAAHAGAYRSRSRCCESSCRPWASTAPARSISAQSPPSLARRT